MANGANFLVGNNARKIVRESGIEIAPSQLQNLVEMVVKVTIFKLAPVLMMFVMVHLKFSSDNN